MQLNFYNTTSEDQKLTAIYSAKNDKQDDIIMSIIEAINRPFSAKDILRRYPVKNVPITSIRRSIHTLNKLGRIIKTGDKVPGLYGRSELQYRLI